jgi:hypothetical protein
MHIWSTWTLVAGSVAFAACSGDGAPVQKAGGGGAAGSTSVTGTSASTSAATTGGGSVTSGSGGATGSSSGTGGSGGFGGATGGAGAGTGGAGMGGSGMGGASGAGGGPGSEIDPKCLDGVVYAAEPLPDRNISVDDLISSYNPANLLPWTIQILNRRYPIGATGPSEAQKKNTLDCFNVAFNMPMPSVQVALDALNTVVHECGHMLDLDGRWIIRADLEYKCNANVVSNSPARSIILKDEFDALGPKGGGLDFVKQIYLEGSSGMQDFRLLFTEFNQYVNQMGSAYAYYDKTKETAVADGSRYFAWFVERYLRLMRMNYATEYNKLAGDTCWRQLILADWGRTHRRWDELRKANMTALWTSEAPKVDALVSDPRLLAEIENLRVLDGCRK